MSPRNSSARFFINVAKVLASWSLSMASFSSCLMSARASSRLAQGDAFALEGDGDAAAKHNRDAAGLDGGGFGVPLRRFRLSSSSFDRLEPFKAACRAASWSVERLIAYMSEMVSVPSAKCFWASGGQWLASEFS